MRLGRTKLIVSLRNVICGLAKCYRCACQISERPNNSTNTSRGFETGRDRTVAPLAFVVSIRTDLRALKTLKPKQNICHFADDIFKCIFLNENIRFSIKISPKLIAKAPINYILALVQVMACLLVGAKPLSEPMVVRSLTHVCVIRPQWVKIALLNKNCTFQYICYNYGHISCKMVTWRNY